MRAGDLAILNSITLGELELTLDQHTRERAPVTRYTAFSWSASRHEALKACPRRYYLHYYGARRVRDANNPVVSAVWWLKQVSSLRAWVGQVVHLTAAKAVRALQAGEAIPREALAEFAQRTYREGIEASRRGTRHGGEWRVLFEHVYPGDPYSVDRDAAPALLADLVDMLVESRAYRRLRRTPPGHIREVDPPFQSFPLGHVPRLGSVPVFAIPDVLLYDGAALRIIDWKTGYTRHPAIRTQAGVYRLYAARRYQAPDEAIRVDISALGWGGRSLPPPGDPLSVPAAEALVRGSIIHMISLMEDVKTNTVSIKHFPRTDDLSRCARCAFKRACWRHEVRAPAGDEEPGDNG